MQYPWPFRRTLVVITLLFLVPMLTSCERTDIQRADGTTADWEDFRGQWVLVNYWAEWCKPCLEEIPELNALDKSPDVTVMGVNFDGITGTALEQLGRKMGIEFLMLGHDPGPDFGWSMPVGLPATFIVDPSGALLETRFGPQTEDDLRTLIGN